MADKYYNGKYTGEQIDAGIAAANAAAPQESTYTKEEIDENCVKKTDYATSNKFGLVKIKENAGLYNNDGEVSVVANSDSGITVGFDSGLRINPATETQISNFSSSFRPMIASHIPNIMATHGITSKTLISEMREQINSLEGKLSSITDGNEVRF